MVCESGGNSVSTVSNNEQNLATADNKVLSASATATDSELCSVVVQILPGPPSTGEEYCRDIDDAIENGLQYHRFSQGNDSQNNNPKSFEGPIISKCKTNSYSEDAEETSSLMVENSIKNDERVNSARSDKLSSSSSHNLRTDDDASKLKTKEPQFIPPDGGYGWVVALASCMANIWTIGFLKSYSVLYLRIMNEFGDSAYRASWIHALLNMSGLLLCPVTGVLCVKFGSRRVAIAGGLLAFCGLLSSAFATSVSTLVFTLGLLVGVGVGWITTPGILIVNLYFDKRRTIACAICVSGSAIGGFFMPMLLEYLLSEYGLRGTLLISSALELQCVVAACLFRPTDIQARIQEQDRRRALRSVRKSSSLPSPVAHLEKNPTWSKLENFLLSNHQAAQKSPSTIDILKNERRKLLARQLSPYRSASLLVSVPNLKEFTIPSDNKREYELETKRTRTVSEMEPVSHHAASADLLKAGGRKRFYSECQSPNDDKDFDLLKNNSSLSSVDEFSSGFLSPKAPTSLETKASHHKISLRQLALKQSSPKVDSPPSLTSNGSAASNLNETGEDTNFSVENLEFGNCFVEPDASPSALENSFKNPGISKVNDSSEMDKNIHPEHQVFPEKKRSLRNELKSFVTAVCASFDTQVLHSKSMILMSISSFFISMAAPLVTYYLHAYFTSIGMSTAKVTTLLSITSASDFCGRMSIGFLADYGFFKLSHLIFLVTSLAAAGTMSVPLTASLAGAASAMGCYGFGLGAYVVLAPAILAKYYGCEKLPATYGFTRLAMGFASFIAPQVNGALIDSTGSYVPSYYLMGSCLLISAVVVLLTSPIVSDTPTADD
ncbi:uncharacterized protein LOC108671951 [Hyalella azteca]|uniref:Uncharacterized protein LOC108671951 n=1 Tax=Hyalella azteca TaxID=294128 RepID=A0A8B7NPJ9_HYAAZ|nr:uncharacterized protein LOC108671951 [Hyalella azteca]